MTDVPPPGGTCSGFEIAHVKNLVTQIRWVVTDRLGSRLPKPLGRTRRRTTGGTTPSPTVPQCLELQCCRVADGFAMLIEVADGELPTLLGRENALRLAEAIRDAYQEGDGQ